MNEQTHTPSSKSIKSNIISANAEGVRVANQCGRMELHKIKGHSIRVVSHNGLGQRTEGSYEIPGVPSLKMIKDLRCNHSGSNAIFYESDVISTCGAKYEGSQSVNLKTGHAE